MQTVQKASKQATEKPAQPRKRTSRRSRVENEGLPDNRIATAGRNLKVKGAQQPFGGNDAINGDEADPRTFAFVTITRPSDATNSEVSKTIRTQAMRHFLREQHRQAITGVVEEATNVKPEEPARYRGRFKLDSWSHKTKTRAINVRREKDLPLPAKKKRANRRASTPEQPDPSPKLSHLVQHQFPNPGIFLDNRQLDPFDSLSIRLGSRSERLLLHYQHSYSMNSVAINSDGDFFSHARTDPALLHSILYLVALHRDLKLGMTDSPEALYHGGEAFRVINKRLQEGISSDMTIAAVAMLVTKENLNGNYEASQIHMQGLQYLVKQRGGIHMIKGVFGRIVTWADFCYANVWNCQPCFPRISPRIHSKGSDFDILDNNPTVLALEDLFGPDSPIISIFSILRSLSFDLDPSHRDTLDRPTASKMIYNVEYELLHLNREQIEDLEPDECLHSFEVIPLKTAAHLWLYLVVREVPRTSQLLYRLVERLQEGLEIQLGGWWNSTYERQTWLLWMLFIGGAASAGRFERWWFVRELAIMCKLRRISHVEELEDDLKKVLWQDAWCKDHVRNLWNDIAMMEDPEEGSLSPEDWQLSQYSPEVVELEEQA